jgi:hypothetical protein
MEARASQAARISVAWLLLLIGANSAVAGIRPDDPDALRRTTSLGDLIAKLTDRPLHIVYVHGMRADGTGANTCPASVRPRRVPIDLPESFWTPDLVRPRRTSSSRSGSPTRWKESTPFVDRYVLPREGAEPIVIDEVNWWPLLFPVKCRLLLVPETDLSGADKAHLNLCARRDAPYYPWLTEEQRDQALKHKPTSGGDALANDFVKQQIMNWGLSDAAMALGPLRT